MAKGRLGRGHRVGLGTRLGLGSGFGFGLLLRLLFRLGLRVSLRSRLIGKVFWPVRPGWIVLVISHLSRRFGAYFGRIFSGRVFKVGVCSNIKVFGLYIRLVIRNQLARVSG